ncbi:MAG: YibE/F family protein [Candidatus Parcubacteria bacterium]|nr:YibE/F family protein [Candidatus Paceibacterota bacterium]
MSIPACCQYHLQEAEHDSKLTFKERLIKNSKQLGISFFVIFVVFAGLILTMPTKPKIDNLPVAAKEYHVATIKSVVDTQSGGNRQTGLQQFGQKIEAEYSFISSKPNQKVSLDYEAVSNSNNQNKLQVGNWVIVGVQTSPQTGEDIKYIVDPSFRIGWIGVIILVFCVLCIYLAGFKGFGALLGMIYSGGVLALFTIPQIVNGLDATIVALITSILIISVSLFVAHGWNRQTVISFGALSITVLFSIGFSFAAVYLTKLSGAGTEDAFYLQNIPNLKNLNLQGLLLAGIIIGTLGVLDDIVTAQVAIVEELSKLNHRLKWQDLFKRAMNVGRAHIVSLVNTLILAYIATSFPLMISLYMFQTEPWWILVNREMIAQEIIRSLAGSLTLLIAVPITTILATVVFTYLHNRPKEVEFRERSGFSFEESLR